MNNKLLILSLITLISISISFAGLDLITGEFLGWHIVQQDGEFSYFDLIKPDRVTKGLNEFRLVPKYYTREVEVITHPLIEECHDVFDDNGSPFGKSCEWVDDVKNPITTTTYEDFQYSLDDINTELSKIGNSLSSKVMITSLDESAGLVDAKSEVDAFNGESIILNVLNPEKAKLRIGNQSIVVISNTATQYNISNGLIKIVLTNATYKELWAWNSSFNDYSKITSFHDFVACPGVSINTYHGWNNIEIMEDTYDKTIIQVNYSDAGVTTNYLLVNYTTSIGNPLWIQDFKLVTGSGSISVLARFSSIGDWLEYVYFSNHSLYDHTNVPNLIYFYPSGINTQTLFGNNITLVQGFTKKNITQIDGVASVQGVYNRDDELTRTLIRGAFMDIDTSTNTDGLQNHLLTNQTGEYLNHYNIWNGATDGNTSWGGGFIDVQGGELINNYSAGRAAIIYYPIYNSSGLAYCNIKTRVKMIANTAGTLDLVGIIGNGASYSHICAVRCFGGNCWVRSQNVSAASEGTPFAVETNVWLNWTMIYDINDGKDRCRLYRNGVLNQTVNTLLVPTGANLNNWMWGTFTNNIGSEARITDLWGNVEFLPDTLDNDNSATFWNVTQDASFAETFANLSLKPLDSIGRVNAGKISDINNQLKVTETWTWESNIANDFSITPNYYACFPNGTHTWSANAYWELPNVYGTAYGNISAGDLSPFTYNTTIGFSNTSWIQSVGTINLSHQSVNTTITLTSGYELNSSSVDWEITPCFKGGHSNITYGDLRVPGTSWNSGQNTTTASCYYDWIAETIHDWVENSTYLHNLTHQGISRKVNGTNNGTDFTNVNWSVGGLYNESFRGEELISDYQNYWKLDETSGLTAYDSGSNLNNLTLNNTEDADWVTGKFINALSLDKVDEYAYTDTVTEFADDAIGTVSLWAKVINDSESLQTVFSLSTDQSDTTYTGFWIFYNMGAGEDNFQFLHYADGAQQWNFQTIDDSTDSHIGNWTHIVVSQDGVEPQFYINGINKNYLVGWADPTPPYNRTWWFNDLLAATEPANVLSIGGVKVLSGVGALTNGTIDDIRIYNRSLTSEEVWSLYTACNNCSGAYDINEGAFEFNASDTGDWLNEIDNPWKENKSHTRNLTHQGILKIVNGTNTGVNFTSVNFTASMPANETVCDYCTETLNVNVGSFEWNASDAGDWINEVIHDWEENKSYQQNMTRQGIVRLVNGTANYNFTDVSWSVPEYAGETVCDYCSGTININNTFEWNASDTGDWLTETTGNDWQQYVAETTYAGVLAWIHGKGRASNSANISFTNVAYNNTSASAMCRSGWTCTITGIQYIPSIPASGTGTDDAREVIGQKTNVITKEAEIQAQNLTIIVGPRARFQAKINGTNTDTIVDYNNVNITFTEIPAEAVMEPGNNTSILFNVVASGDYIAVTNYTMSAVNEIIGSLVWGAIEINKEVNYSRQVFWDNTAAITYYNVTGQLTIPTSTNSSTINITTDTEVITPQEINVPSGFIKWNKSSMTGEQEIGFNITYNTTAPNITTSFIVNATHYTKYVNLSGPVEPIYTNVKVYTSVNESIVIPYLYKKISGAWIDVTTNKNYNVLKEDTNDNGRTDRMTWYEPSLNQSSEFYITALVGDPILTQCKNEARNWENCSLSVAGDCPKQHIRTKIGVSEAVYWKYECRFYNPNIVTRSITDKFRISPEATNILYDEVGEELLWDLYGPYISIEDENIQPRSYNHHNITFYTPPVFAELVYRYQEEFYVNELADVNITIRLTNYASENITVDIYKDIRVGYGKEIELLDEDNKTITDYGLEQGTLSVNLGTILAGETKDFRLNYKTPTATYNLPRPAYKLRYNNTEYDVQEAEVTSIAYVPLTELLWEYEEKDCDLIDYVAKVNIFTEQLIPDVNTIEFTCEEINEVETLVITLGVLDVGEIIKIKIYKRVMITPITIPGLEEMSKAIIDFFTNIWMFFWQFIIGIF